MEVILITKEELKRNTTERKNLKLKIEELREKLNRQIYERNSLLDSELYETSLQLDLLIEEYLEVTEKESGKKRYDDLSFVL